MQYMVLQLLLGWIFHILPIQVFVDRNPVPNPGAADLFLEFHPLHRMTQSTLYDHGFWSHSCKGEGCSVPTDTAEATDWTLASLNTAKCGQPPPTGYGPQSDQQLFTDVQKRSYKRACRRALCTGAAWYRGQLHTVGHFPPRLVAQLSQTPLTTPCRPRSTMPARTSGLRHRLSCFHWNPGGLSQPAFSELKLWLRQHPVDIVTLVETRWSFNSTWHDSQWTYVHSATSEGRTGGILVMLSKRLISFEHVGHHAVLDGRLLHVRLHHARRAMGLITAYQYVDSRTVQSHRNRQHFWNSFTEYLAELPSRNQFLCTGDFNCALPKHPPWCGIGDFQWQGHRHMGSQHRDMDSFMECLRNHSLVALNSWDRSAGPTYFHGDHAARIDFVLMRLVSCDGVAKQVTYLDQAAFLPVNSTHHIPMVCTILKQHVAYQKHSNQPKCNYRQRTQCRQAALQDSTPWHQLQRATESVLGQAITADHVDSWSIEKVHDSVSHQFSALFPNSRTTSRTQENCALHELIRTKWYHHQQIRLLRFGSANFSLRTGFQVWKHWSRFRHLETQQRHEAKQARIRKFQDLCHDVEAAAQQQDAHRMFTIINRYTPKRANARIRLRTPDGHIADQHTTHNLLVQYVQDAWQGPDWNPHHSERPPGVPFTEQDIVQAIVTSHANKSVALPFLPAIVWKSSPEVLAQYLMSLLRMWWNQSPPYIPQCWRDAWVYFLPKPGKPCTQPDQLRPIALMEPFGKLIIGLLASQLKQFCFPFLSSAPHFGFLPYRAATDAIARVSDHCRRIRSLVHSNRRTVPHQILARPRFVLVGGLQLFLDLTRAFDCVVRSLLFTHMLDRGVPEGLVSLLSHWHHATHYNLTYRDNTVNIPIKVGVRQGCKAAPLLWVLFMDYMLSQLAPLTGLAWISQTLTLYADDIHVGCEFDSVQSLDTHLRNIGHLLDVLETLKLQLSYQKSHVLFSVAGSNSRNALKGRLVHKSATRCILIPRATGDKTPLPLSSYSKYLGVIMSYHAFEDQTWQHRRKSGLSAFARLKPWLTNSRIARHRRLYLWRVCINTILTYGILATNVTIKVLHDYQAVVYRMLRTIVGDHPYRTRHTHQQVLHSIQHPHPLDLLQTAAMGIWQRVQRRTDFLHPDDFLFRVNWTHLLDLQHLIHCARTTSVEVPIGLRDSPIEVQAQCHCQYCPFVTHSLANLRRHCTMHHEQSCLRTSPVSYLSMSLQGRSQCNRCFRLFTTWRSFCIHVERDCCQATLRPSMEPPRHPGDPNEEPTDRAANLNRAITEAFQVTQQEFWPTLKQIVLHEQWAQLSDHPEIGEFLTHNCMICDIWTNRCQELHSHYRLHHSDMTPGIFAKSAQLTKIIGSGSPCCLCQKPFKLGHTCTVATQISALYLHCFKAEERNLHSLTCNVCQEQFARMSELHRHLRQAHSLQVHDWNPARDSLQDSDACAHCGAVFHTRDGLRRHIIDGNCDSFDPAATNVPLDAVAKWGDFLASGRLEPTEVTAIQRLNLTVKCQFCGEGYSRAMDLTAHLQQSHGELWATSHFVVQYLLQTLISRTGCICNPQTNDSGLSHVCNAVRQWAMIFMLSTLDLLLPIRFAEDVLRAQLRNLATHTHLDMLINVVLDRDFAMLWTSPTLLKLFRNWCVVCGGWFPTTQMVTHQLGLHHAECQWAAQLRNQLIRCMQTLQANDFQCKYCQLVYNHEHQQPGQTIVDRFEHTQAHFSFNCPVLQQIALVLQPVRHGPDGPGATGHRAFGILPTAESTAAGGQRLSSRKRRGATVKEEPTCRSRRTRQPGGSDSTAGGAHPDQAPDAGGAPTREATTGHPSSGLLRFLRPAQQTGMCPLAGSEDNRMEGPGSVYDTDTVLETDLTHLPASCPDSGTSGQGSEALAIQTRRAALGHGGQQQDDSCRRVLALSTLEPRATGSGDLTSPGAPDAPGPQGVGAPAGTPTGQRPCGEISCTTPSTAGCAVAPPATPSPGRSVAHTTTLGPEFPSGECWGFQ